MKLYRVKENGKIETATILDRVDFNCYSTTYKTKYHTIIHYPLPNKFKDEKNSIAFFETKKEALKEYKKNIKEQGNKMKKIETWEDLKEALRIIKIYNLGLKIYILKTMKLKKNFYL